MDGSASETACRTAAADEQLTQQIVHRLHASGRPPFRGLRVAVAQGRVRLSGFVTSWYLKQLAQTAVLSCDGIRGLDNHLIVATTGTPRDIPAWG